MLPPHSSSPQCLSHLVLSLLFAVAACDNGEDVIARWHEQLRQEDSVYVATCRRAATHLSNTFARGAPPSEVLDSVFVVHRLIMPHTDSVPGCADSLAKAELLQVEPYLRAAFEPRAKKLRAQVPELAEFVNRHPFDRYKGRGGRITMSQVHALEELKDLSYGSSYWMCPAYLPTADGKLCSVMEQADHYLGVKDAARLVPKERQELLDAREWSCAQEAKRIRTTATAENNYETRGADYYATRYADNHGCAQAYNQYGYR